MCKEKIKEDFLKILKIFATSLKNYVQSDNGQWTIKGFIDKYKNIYSISNDTKITSKILEIHLFPKFLEFANNNGYELVLTDEQNYYPDLSLVSKKDERIKFAVDLKTSYKKSANKINGFTLGSHGSYFKNRSEKKNIQFPYSQYMGHYCLGIIYTRNENSTIDNTKQYSLKELVDIPSAIKCFQFFAAEKWTIASDKGGSGNTANIGSAKNIDDIISGNGLFTVFQNGEKIFDNYWINYKKMNILTIDKDGNEITKPLTSIEEYITHRNMDKKLLESVKERKRKKKAEK